MGLSAVTNPFLMTHLLCYAALINTETEKQACSPPGKIKLLRETPKGIQVCKTHHGILVPNGCFLPLFQTHGGLCSSHHTVRDPLGNQRRFGGPDRRLAQQDESNCVSGVFLFPSLLLLWENITEQSLEWLQFS